MQYSGNPENLWNLEIIRNVFGNDTVTTREAACANASLSALDCATTACASARHSALDTAFRKWLQEGRRKVSEICPPYEI
jgi:peptidyl-tRNA hydrolase